MTKAQARKLGSEAAKSRAEWMYTDTSYDRLAWVLQKYRKAKIWKEQAADDTFHLAAGLQNKIPPELMSDFRNAYATTGSREIERYIKEAKSDGLLKEL